MFGKIAVAHVCGRFQVIAEDLLRGAWLAGDFREAEKKWLGQPAARYGEDADGFLFPGARRKPPRHGGKGMGRSRNLRPALRLDSVGFCASRNTAGRHSADLL